MSENEKIPATLNPDGTNPHSSQMSYLSQGSKHETVSTNYAELRSSPKGTIVKRSSKDEFVAEIKCVLRFWFWFAPAVAISLSILVLPFSLILVMAWDPMIQTLGVVLIVASIGAVGLAFWRTRFWVKVVAHREAIKFGERTYDRKHYTGMRIGYSIDGDSTLKNDFFDQSMGMTALRLAYGRWGEDLPYLVNKYHAPEIVIWLNEHIDAVGAPPPRENAPSEGRREQSF